MSSTDDRIVRMQFDNAQFKRAATDTQKQLGDLNKAVDSAGKTKGLLDLDRQMQQVGITASKMQVITTTALATIANKATNVALNLAKSLTFDPIRQGFSEYEALLTKQNTIMNATGKSAKEVKQTLTELNRYSDETIYSFSNMTESITKFVNAGVPLDRAVVSIKGIANAAAFAGASSEEANRAMYAFSQAMSMGFIGLQDWNQIENANLGTIRFKEELLNAAVAVGTLTKQGNQYVTASGKTISATKGWRDGMQEQWATTEVLNDALGKYADRTTTLGKKAFEAAQEVRTFSAFIDTLRESIGSGWASVFTAFIGNLEQSTKMWTSLSEAVGVVVTGFFDWITVTLKVWRQMGGFEKLMEGFGNVLAPIGALLGAIGEAFRAAFPDSGSGAGKALYGLSAAFASLTYPLELLARLIRKLTDPLTFFFQILRIGGAIVGEITGKIVSFVKAALDAVEIKAPSGNTLIEWLGALGSAIGGAVDQIVGLLNKGKSIREAFSNIDFDLPSLPSIDLSKVVGGGGDQAKSAISSITSPLAGVSGIAGTAESVFAKLGAVVSDASSDVQSAGGVIANVLGDIWDGLKNFVGGINWEDVIGAFNIAVLSTFLITVSRFLESMRGSFQGFSQLMDGAGNALSSFQTKARAEFFLNLGIALLLFAGAMWVLSKIPYDRLASGFVIIFGLFRMMSTAVDQMTKSVERMQGANSSFKIISLGLAIGFLSVAMLALAAAMLIYNKVDFTSVAKGTAVMLITIYAIRKLGEVAEENAKSLLAGSLAIGIVAGAMIGLALALLAFKLVDFDEMAKAGLVLTAVSLSIGLLAKLPAEAIAKVGAAMLAASFGMLALAAALIIFGLVKWESIGKAAVVLALLTASLAVLMLVGNPLAISGLVGMAAALVGLALACLILNKVNWSSIGKAALVLTVLLAAFAVGAAIFTAFLYAIAPLAPVLIALAAGIALLGVAFLAFSAALAIAMSLVAVGATAFAALGVGAAVAITAFVQTLAAEAPILKKAALNMLQTFFDGIVEAIPIVINGVNRIIDAIIKELSKSDNGKKSGEAGKKITESFGDKLSQAIPLLIEKGKDLIIGLLKGLRSKAPEISKYIADLVIGLVNGLAARSEALVASGINLMLKILKGIGNGLPDLVGGAIKIFIDFLHRLADAIRSESRGIGGGLADVVSAMATVGLNIARGLAQGIRDGASEVLGALKSSILDKLPKFARDALDINSPSKVFSAIGSSIVEGLTKGIKDNAVSAITAVAGMLVGAVAIAREYVSKFVQELDQDAIAARAKAQGLAAAAKKARASAKRTKTKSDDKAAKNLGERAAKADKVADAAEKKAEKAKERAAREEQYENASTLEKAQMRAEDAAQSLDQAKAAEKRAAAAIAEARALEEQAKKAGSPKERKKLLAQAEKLRKEAAEEAKKADKFLDEARNNAGDALALQEQAEAEEIKAEEEAEAFARLSDAEKAAMRRKQAEELQKSAEAKREQAKKLALTDVEAANKLAQEAFEEARQARDYIREAKGYEGSGGSSAGGVFGTPVNMAATDAAAIAMGEYEDLYLAAMDAASSGPSMEFHQYNTSPEALSPSEIYRQSNNLFAFAASKITGNNEP